MHAARRCNACENIWHIPSVACLRRLRAATFYRHENFVTAAVQLGALLVFLVSLPLSLLSLLSFLLSFLLSPPSLLAKLCAPHPSEWANLRKYALETYPQERIAKIYALRQNHTIPVCSTLDLREKKRFWLSLTHSSL